MADDVPVDTVARWVRIAAGIAGRGPSERRLRRAVAGRIVLVTGASEGIGAATARRLGSAGATVLLVARTAARLDEVRDEIVAAGGTAYAHPADLSSPPAAAALADDLLRRYNRVDVVVSNAGRSIRRSVADTADRFHDIQRVTDLNFLGPVQLLLSLLPAMRAAGGGHIVNVSTASLAVPLSNWSAYLSSKAAFDSWLRNAGPELRADGVTVSTVYCGLVRTRMIAPTAHYRRVPAMTPDEAAGVVCRSVTYRRRWWPWWARVGAVLSAALPGLAEWTATAALRIARAVEPARALASVGLWRPGRLLRLTRAYRRHGPTLAAAVAASRPSRVAIVDADGPVAGVELADLAAAYAVAARDELGVRPADRVAVACAGHRWFVAAVAGVTRLGADAVLLPPDLPADRLAEVVAAHGITAAIADPKAATGLAGHVPTLDRRVSGAADRPAEPGAMRGRGRRPRPGRLIVLTSGTTAPPRGVTRRPGPRTLLGPVTTHLRLIPLRPGEPIVVATPPFHGYGLSYLIAGLALGAPVVLAAGARPEQILDAVARHRAATLLALPIQLRRVCELPADVRAGRDLSSLRAVVSGSAPLAPALCTRLREVVGDRVFNLYGTTEAGWAAIATPADLAAAPGTVGRPPRGVRLRVLDRDGVPLPPGQVGEVHVHGWQPDGRWQATGDLGHLDLAGRLFLDGRVDGRPGKPTA